MHISLVSWRPVGDWKEGSSVMKPETHNAELGGLIGHTNNRVSHKTIISCEVKGYEVIINHINPMVLLHKLVQNPTGQRHLEPNSNTYSSHHSLRYTGLRAQSWCILKGGQSSCWSSQRLSKIFFTEPYIIFRVKFSSKTLIQTWQNGFTQNTLRDAAKHLHLEYDSDYHQVSGKVVSGSHLYFDNANVILLIQALWLSQHLAITT